MFIKPSNLASSRREFLMNILPAGALFCLGCGNLAAWAASQEAQKAAEKKHKFQDDSGMSFQEVFEFACGEFAHVMKYFGNEIGKDNLIEMLKRNGDENAKRRAQMWAKNRQINEFASFRAKRREKPGRFSAHILTSTIIKDTDKAPEQKITECLYAKAFRDADAADIGYAFGQSAIDFRGNPDYEFSTRVVIRNWRRGDFAVDLHIPDSPRDNYGVPTSRAIRAGVTSCP